MSKIPNGYKMTILGQVSEARDILTQAVDLLVAGKAQPQQLWSLLEKARRSVTDARSVTSRWKSDADAARATQTVHVRIEREPRVKERTLPVRIVHERG